MLASKQGFGGPAPFQTSAAEVMSCSSSFGSTSVDASRSVPANISDSHLSHFDVNKDSKDNPSKPLSLADKKLQRLARNRATASVSRSRKREHLHTLQMRVLALEQENQDLVQQVAVRDAELKRFRRERGEPEDCVVMVQPAPAPEQVEARSPKAIILRPATSALPRILCTTVVPTSTQQQPQAVASRHGGAGSKHKAASEPLQKVSRQRSCSLTPSTDDSIPVTKVKSEASPDSLEGPAQQQASLPAALCKQAKQHATFNVVTSGEYSHLTLKRQLGVKTVLPSPFVQQQDGPAGPHQAPPFSTFPVGEDGYSASELYAGGSQSYDSCYLPVNEMPHFAFQAGDSDMPQQQGLWPQAQVPHAQSGMNVESTAHGTLAAQGKPGDWCSIMAQGLELSSQAPLCIPDLLPLSPSAEPPPSLCASWDKTAWQPSWEHQQPQQQQQQQQQADTVKQPFLEVPTCQDEGVTASAGLEFVDPAVACSGADAAWWMLPSAGSVENMLQADSIFASGDHENQNVDGQSPV